MSGPTTPSEEHFDKGQWGFDGSVWRKLNLIWAYYDRLAEQKLNADTGAGTIYLTHTAVPAGEVWVLTGISVLDTPTAATVIAFANFVGVNEAVYGFGALTVGVYKVTPPMNVVLKAGDYMLIEFAGCALHDLIASNIWGYKMKVA